MALPSRGTFLQLATLTNQDASVAHADVRDQVAFNGAAWEIATPYVHPCMARGSDGIIYDSVQDSTGQDPVSDNNNTYWINSSISKYNDFTLSTGYTLNSLDASSKAVYRLGNNGSTIKIIASLSKLNTLNNPNPFSLDVGYRPPMDFIFPIVYFGWENTNAEVFASIKIEKTGICTLKSPTGFDIGAKQIVGIYINLEFDL